MTDWKQELEVLHEQVVGLMTDEAHTVEIREDGWTVQHPVVCRPQMLDCPVTRIMVYGFLARDEDGEYNEPVENVTEKGRYTVRADASDPYGWEFTKQPGEPVDALVAGLDKVLLSIERLIREVE